MQSQVGLRKHHYKQSLWRWWNSNWAISNPKRWCRESAALNMPANLENSAVATGLEKVSFHSKKGNTKECSNYRTIAFISHASRRRAPHSSTLAWKIPWMAEPGRLWSMGLRRVGHNWATSLSLFTFMHWRRKWQPTRVLAWRILGTAEPGGLPSMESHRVGHDWSDLAAAAAHANKVMLKILQARLQQYVNCELPDVQAGFRKGRGTRDQIANIHWISKKLVSSKKTSTSALLTMSNPFTVWITINCGKFFKGWEYQTTLPTSWEICMQVRKQQLELDMEQ